MIIQTVRSRLASEAGKKAVKADGRLTRAFKRPNVTEADARRIRELKWSVDHHLKAYKRHERLNTVAA